LRSNQAQKFPSVDKIVDKAPGGCSGIGAKKLLPGSVVGYAHQLFARFTKHRRL
jgi:hypothetical protein